jgi:beta-galactosidase
MDQSAVTDDDHHHRHHHHDHDQYHLLIPRFPSSSHRLDVAAVPIRRPTVWPIHDLVLNQLLVYILPTHRRTLLLKFLVVAALDVFILVWWWYGWKSPLYDHDHHHYPLLPRLLRPLVPPTTALAFLFYWCWYYRRVWLELVVPVVNSTDHQLVPAGWWTMDPTVTDRNRLAMHVPLRHYVDEDQARRGACRPDVIGTAKDSPNVCCLDDQPWQFTLQPTVQRGLAVATSSSTDAPAVWRDNMPIPAHWTLVDGVDDRPIYTNQKYPFPCQPPLVPYDNPTGVYRLTSFDVPLAWRTTTADSSSSSSSSFDASTYTILLHGIESAAYFFCNNLFVGFTKDSRLPAEFDVTTCLRPVHNTITIVVVRWSDGSYLEDQDHWWMAGIQRSIELIRRPVDATLLDFQVQADATGHIAIHAWTRASNSTIVARLYADEQLSPDGDRWKQGSCLWEATGTTSARDGARHQNKNGTTTTMFGVVLSGTVVPCPKLWNAEEPHLYTLTISVQSTAKNGTTMAQVESCRVGFRTVDIVDGTVRVNGVPITVCGMNRHEHDPDHGKVVSLDSMMKDICLLKYVGSCCVYIFYFPREGLGTLHGID